MDPLKMSVNELIRDIVDKKVKIEEEIDQLEALKLDAALNEDDQIQFPLGKEIDLSDLKYYREQLLTTIDIINILLKEKS